MKMITTASCASLLSICGSMSAGASADTQALEAAFEGFVKEIRTAGDFIRAHPFYRDPENRAAGFAFLSSMLIRTLEEDVVQDPDFPFFRVLDQRIREGGDNPDQTYFMTRLRGGVSYRVWGRAGSERRLEFQVYAGDPFAPGGGRVASFLGADEIDLSPDGSFEVILSPERPASPGERRANWLANPTDASELLVRQTFAAWSDALPGEVHIDRIGFEGAAKPPLTEAAMTDRLRQAADTLRTHVRVWPAMIQNRYVAARPANQLSPPFDPGALGGVPGRWMAQGVFDLAPEEALIVRSWPASGNYQSIQLADLWFSSLEYANRQTSLTADQAHRASDGSYWFVIAGRDPGVPNWLDTVGRSRGVILLRYDGMQEKAFDRAKWPQAMRVKLAELRDRLPRDTPAVASEARRAELAARRRHVQRRLGR